MVLNHLRKRLYNTKQDYIILYKDCMIYMYYSNHKVPIYIFEGIFQRSFATLTTIHVNALL